MSREFEKLMGRDRSLFELVQTKMMIENENAADKEYEIAQIDEMISALDVSNERIAEESQKAEKIHRVAKLVVELKGSRTVRRMAEDTGVAASYITGIKYERYLPSADILRKLARPESKPQNGVLLEDLMIAAGYQTKYMDDETISEVIEGLQGESNEDTDSKRLLDELYEKVSRTYTNGDIRDHEINISEAQRRMQRKRIMQERDRFEKVAKGLIYQELVEKNIEFRKNENTHLNIRGMKPDVVIDINNREIDEWWLEFKYIPELNENEHIHRGSMLGRQILGRYIFAEPKDYRKYTIVTNNETEFEIWKGYKDKLSFRGELSIILVDLEGYSLEEVYLAHFELNNTSAEFGFMR